LNFPLTLDVLQLSRHSKSQEQQLKTTLVFGLRLLLLAILYFVIFSVVSAILLPRPTTAPAPDEAAAILAALLVISIVNSSVVAYLLVRSRWTGFKLIITLWWVLFGVTTLMSQIETFVFIRNLPPGFLPRLFLSGAVFAAIFSTLAVIVFGKVRSRLAEDSTQWWTQLSVKQWVVRLTIIAVAYVIIYFTFGYYIAWQNPALVAYYGGTNSGGYLDQLQRVWRDTPWLPLLQIGRALLWTALAIPVIRLMKGRWWEAGLAVALFFSVVMNTQLLLPNPLMPTDVRMSHLLETATSNFLFGWIVVWLLRPLHYTLSTGSEQVRKGASAAIQTLHN
jgi:hypothetical protein